MGRLSSTTLAVVRTTITFLERLLLFSSVLCAIALLTIPRAFFSKEWASIIAGRSQASDLLLVTISAVQRHPLGETFGLVPLPPPKTVAECSGHDKRSIIDTFAINVAYPKKIPVGDAALIKATPELTGATLKTDNEYAICKGHRTTRALTDEEIQGERSQVSDGIGGFELDVAGADVKPTGTDPLIDGTATWSISPKAPGRLNGLIEAKSDETPLSELLNRVVYRQEKPAAFQITAYENPFESTRFLSWVPKILGSLLTIPGIIAFWREFKGRRQLAREEEKKERHIIIP